MNAFFAELNNSGTALVYSTFLGGGISLGALASLGDEATGIAVDGQGLVYLTGMACTGNFPVTAGAFEPQNLDGEITGECTAFLTKVNPAPNTRLLYSTFLGGTGNGDASDFYYGEGANGLAIDQSGNVYLAGFTLSVDFPVTAGVFATAFTGPSNEEAFVTEFNGSEMKTLPIPTLTLTSNTSSVLFGQPVTFTATVQSVSGSNTPTGYVGFDFFQEEPSDDEGLGVGFGPWTTVALNGSGVAIFTTSSLDQLETPVNAFYLGDANNAPATGTMTQTLTELPTTTTVTASANNVPYGGPVVFTADVLDSAGKPAKGSVAFWVGTTLYAGSGLDSAGQATWTNGIGGPELPVGTDTVEVVFTAAPFNRYDASSGSVIVTITPLGTTPTPVFAPPAGTYAAAQQVSLSDSDTNAIVYYSTSGSTPVPGVSPQFVAGSMIPVNASETISAVAVAPGYSASNVVSAAYTITPPAPDFSVAATPGSQTVTGGQSATASISVTPANGFNSAVTFSCSGLPSGATCSFSPATVTPSGGVASTTLTVSTTTADAALHRDSRPLIPVAALAALLCCFGFRKRRLLVLVLVMSAAGLGLLTSCGGGGTGSGGGGGGGGGGGSQSATYTITVTATSGTLQHAVAISLTVN